VASVTVGECVAAASAVLGGLGLLLWRPIARAKGDAKLAGRVVEAAVAYANDMHRDELTVNEPVLNEYKDCLSLAEQRFGQDRRLTEGLDAYKKLHDGRGETRRLLGLGTLEKAQGKKRLTELLDIIRDTFGRRARFK